LLRVRFDDETVFLRFVLDEAAAAGSEETTPGLVQSQNTAEAAAEAEELSLLLLNLRLFAELSACESSVLKLLEEPPGRKSNESMYDDFVVAKNLLLLLLLFPTSENFSKFLSFSDDIELIFDIIFMLGVLCKLFKLSNECFEMRELFLRVDAFDDDDEKYIPPPSLFLLFSLEFPFCGSQISDIFCQNRDEKKKKLIIEAILQHYN
jgi:hypothetical protein